jgi:hypothetical protein
MTALTKDTRRDYREGVDHPYPVAGSQIIYGNAFVCANATGFAVPGSDTAGLLFVGVGKQHVDNSDGADGDLQVVVRRKHVHKVKIVSTITQANVGDKVYLVDDDTMDLAAGVTNSIYGGIIVGFIDGNIAWVDIEPAVMQA